MRARTGPWCGNDRAVLTGTLQNTNLHVDSSLLDLVVDRFTVADEVCIYPQERKVMSAQQEGPCVPVGIPTCTLFRSVYPQTLSFVTSPLRKLCSYLRMSSARLDISPTNQRINLFKVHLEQQQSTSPI